MLDDLIDRVPDTNNYYMQATIGVGENNTYGFTVNNETQQDFGGIPVKLAEYAWEILHALTVRIYTNATDYAAGADPIAVACKKGCGHNV